MGCSYCISGTSGLQLLHIHLKVNIFVTSRWYVSSNAFSWDVCPSFYMKSLNTYVLYEVTKYTCPIRGYHYRYPLTDTPLFFWEIFWRGGGICNDILISLNTYVLLYEVTNACPLWNPWCLSWLKQFYNGIALVFYNKKIVQKKRRNCLINFRTEPYIFGLRVSPSGSSEPSNLATVRTRA